MLSPRTVRHALYGLSTLALAASLAACSKSERTASSSSSAPPTWLLASEPTDARTIAEVKAAAKEGDAVVMRARIGGRKTPISANSAAFTVMDLAIPHCGQLGDDDHCNTPWDYCCETPETIQANAATVQLVGPEGAPTTHTPLEAGLAPLDEIIIVGTVGPRPDPSVLTIRATGVYRAGGA